MSRLGKARHGMAGQIKAGEDFITQN